MENETTAVRISHNTSIPGNDECPKHFPFRTCMSTWTFRACGTESVNHKRLTTSVVYIVNDHPSVCWCTRGYTWHRACASAYLNRWSVPKYGIFIVCVLYYRPIRTSDGRQRPRNGWYFSSDSWYFPKLPPPGRGPMRRYPELVFAHTLGFIQKPQWSRIQLPPQDRRTPNSASATEIPPINQTANGACAPVSLAC